MQKYGVITHQIPEVKRNVDALFTGEDIPDFIDRNKQYEQSS
jgi:hypothetical protein